jgi:MoaA/NifB/PqqE/SkfB family radical SAM enzyme
MCYTPKTTTSLTEEDVLQFVYRYQKTTTLETVTFCGGEVFLLPYMPHLINTLTKNEIFVQIITNGSIDVLDKLNAPNAINCIVSIDGQKEYHDKNRGKGMFDKSVSFLKHAQKKGFHVEIFSIITKENVLEIDAFENAVEKELGKNIAITYHPRKPLSYLAKHPTANRVGETNGFGFLSQEEMVRLMNTKQTFPPKRFGCFQISLMSDKKVYGCCEGITPIGLISDTPRTLILSLKKRVAHWKSKNKHSGCLGCVEPDFLCGFI